MISEKTVVILNTIQKDVSYSSANSDTDRQHMEVTKVKRWQILLNIILEIVVFFAGGILLLIGIPKLMGFFWPFVASWILALLATPLCRFLEKHIRLKKQWASAVIIILVLVALASLGYLLVTRLGSELMSLLSDAPLYYEYFRNAIDGLGESVNQILSPVLPDVSGQIQEVVDEFLVQAGSAINNIAPKSVEVLGSAAANLTSGLLGVVVMILSAYFFIADRDKIAAAAYRVMPDDIKEYVRNLKNRLMEALSGFVLAQFKIMGIIFLILLIGLTILKNPYSLLLAVLISFLDLLPVFGTGTVLIPWMLMALLRGEYRQGIFLLVLYIVCLLARQVLQPKIIGDSVGLDTLPTLVLIYTGYKLAGMKGIILGLIVGVVVLTLYRFGVFDKKIKRVNRLLYEYRHYDDE